MFDTDDTAHQRMASFVERSGFRDRGAVITDLDGTAVHEHEGRVQIARSVLEGLEAVHAAGRQVVINSLRFPLSVIRVYGDEWVAAANGSVPVSVVVQAAAIGCKEAVRSSHGHDRPPHFALLSSGDAAAQAQRQMHAVCAATCAAGRTYDLPWVTGPKAPFRPQDDP